MYRRLKKRTTADFLSEIMKTRRSKATSLSYIKKKLST